MASWVRGNITKWQAGGPIAPRRACQILGSAAAGAGSAPNLRPMIPRRIPCTPGKGVVGAAHIPFILTGYARDPHALFRSAGIRVFFFVKCACTVYTHCVYSDFPDGAGCRETSIFELFGRRHSWPVKTTQRAAARPQELLSRSLSVQGRNP